MPNLTANYGLKKPLSEEFYDVNIQNENMDIIDEALGKCASIPVTDEVPDDSSIWIDPNDTTIEENHVNDKNNPHGVTIQQIGAAPSGYGLGTTSDIGKWNGDANTLTKQGWHRLESGTTNGVGESASVRVDGYAETGLTQTAYTRSGFKRIRTCVDGVWSEWEWVNPPMKVGVEYRTTERWQGKAVYVKVVDMGRLSATANTTISVDASVYGTGVDEIVDYGGSMFTGTWAGSLPYFSNKSQVYVFANRTGIAAWSSKDGYDGYYVRAWVKYTK